MPWFSVEDLGGRVWTTADADGMTATVVAFLSRHSPYVKHIQGSLGVITQSLLGQPVRVLGVSSNDTRAYPSDAKDKLEAQAREAGFAFPYCVDETQQAAKAFQASCTPEFYVYDRELRLVYHGQYDASRPDNSISITGEDLLQAVNAVVAGEIVSGNQSLSLGCSIKWRAGNEPSYVLSVL